MGETAVQGLELRDLKTQERTTLPVRGVFVAIGLAPENQMFQGALSLDEAGYLVADESCQTSIPGVFVAGDTRRKALRQIVTATSDGAMAAFGASNFLNQLQFQGCARAVSYTHLSSIMTDIWHNMHGGFSPLFSSTLLFSPPKFLQGKLL